MPATERVRRLAARGVARALPLKPVRAVLHYTEHRGPQLADGITYRALFSVFAAVLLGFTLTAAWLSGGAPARAALERAVDAAIPGLIGEHGLIHPDQLAAAPAGLTLAGAVSIVGLVGAAMGAISSTRSALQVLTGRARKASWLRVTACNLGLAAAIAVGVALSAGVTFVGTVAIDAVRAWAGPASATAADVATRALSVVVVFALDAAMVALLFAVLSGVRARAREIVPGAVIGGVGLTVLQQLSGLFVRGAASNPLLASFAALIALLLWVNLSAQVVLIACAYIVVGVAERHDRIRERFGARTFAERGVQRAEDAVRAADDELRRARTLLKNP